MSTADPFPERITHGCPVTARALRAHAAACALDADRALARLAQTPDEATPAQRARQRDAARRYARAAEERRAFETLADLHERRRMPSPLFTVRTRRHVRTLLAVETFADDADRALRTALRWTLGLPMPRRTGFEVMREGFDRLGLLGSVPLPLAVAQLLRPPAETAAPAPATATTEEVHTPEAYAQAVRDRAARLAPAWVWHVTQSRGIDYEGARRAGLPAEAAARAVAAWLVGIVVYGHRPLAWRRPPFARDGGGRLRPVETDGAGVRADPRAGAPLALAA